MLFLYIYIIMYAIYIEDFPGP